MTTSLVDPLDDFEVNARGTLNLLEAVRSRPEPPPLIFTSTNKVYGDLEDLELEASETRYVPLDPEVRAFGVDEGLSRRIRPLAAVVSVDVRELAGDDVHDDGTRVRVPGA